MIELGDLQSPENVLDAGCGIGGSAREFVDKYNSNVLGVTISRQQVRIANQIIARNGLTDKITVREMDVMKISAEDGPFDLVWCVECLEHIGPKRALIELFFELMESGGKLLLTTWNLTQQPDELSREHAKHLEDVCQAFHWEPLVSGLDLYMMCRDSGFVDIQHRDWTEEVTPFWKDIRISAMDPRNLFSLRHLSWSVLKGAYDLKYLQRATRSDLIRYQAFCCTRK